jgi:hypothetical protein
LRRSWSRSLPRHGGVFTIFEESKPVDAPLHVHQNEDELIFVLGGARVLGRREGVPSGAPAGLEGFFRELAEADLGPDAHATSSEPYGVTRLN